LNSDFSFKFSARFERKFICKVLSKKKLPQSTAQAGSPLRFGTLRGIKIKKCNAPSCGKSTMVD